MTDNWPLDYGVECRRRLKCVQAAQDNLAFAKTYYAENPIDFICDFCWTMDPRKVGTGEASVMPLVLFQKQREFILFVMQLLKNQCGGLVEKARDMGVTWTAVALSVWLWLFEDGASVGWGSRKEEYVDRIGDMSSIFEKIRFTVRMLPKFLLPATFKKNEHMGFMKLINPENNSSVVGEIGDNIGRGGRTSLYFKDESAHYAHPVMINTSLSHNTNIEVDISSVNGTGNPFHSRRMAGIDWDGEIIDKTKTQVLVMPWQSHPGKNQDWYDKLRQFNEDEGTLAGFAQEVDRDYSASVLGTIIKSEWVEAAIGLARDFNLDVSGKKRAGLDVADDGISGDRNALVIVEGLQIEDFQFWGQVDTGVTSMRAYNYSLESGVFEIQYDSIGVGSGVKASFNHMRRVGELSDEYKIIPWTASAEVVDPFGFVDKPAPGDLSHQGPKNKDFFQNFKAQAWWAIKKRFHQAWRCREGLDFDSDNIISINPDIPVNKLRMLVSELSQPVRKESVAGKTMIDKAPKGSKSPNVADAVIIAAYPAKMKTTRTQELVI